MTMEAGADTQQSGDPAVSESEAQQISLAQVIHTHTQKHRDTKCCRLWY